ncbi:hypothetical protein [Enterococcus mediterraneensis]|uniref:hypothetical protein n=1 Tax=Enterococcus mediterraneensis TaxID=2364791 RepID=UPI000F07211C|nr:hypothetical protein [Enterococcus mediterraneensis]
MKYYHLIGVSSGLFALQLFLEKAIHLRLSLPVRWTFVILQGGLLISYSVLTVFYGLMLRKTRQQIKQTKPARNVIVLKEKTHSLKKAS